MSHQSEPLDSLNISEYSTVQYSTVQYSTVQYSTVQYSTVQYSTVQYSTVQYSPVQYSTVQYGVLRTYGLDELGHFSAPERVPTGQSLHEEGQTFRAQLYVQHTAQ